MRHGVLGMSSLLRGCLLHLGRPGRQNHEHISSLDFRLTFHDGRLFHFVSHSHQYLASQFGMGELATPEHNGDFHLVAVRDKPLGVFLLHFIVMVLNIRTQFDFFQRDNFLFLFSFFITFLLFKPKLAEIHDPAGRRFSIRSDFHQIQLLIRSHLDKSRPFFRWGGEEFVIYCPDMGLSETVELAESFRQLVEQTQLLPEWRVTISLGVAFWHGPKDSSVDIFKRMDEALYRAKRNGRNTVATETLA